jgi:hypothetical protein
MNHQDRERIPEDLDQIAELLRIERPQAGPLELDRIKLRTKLSATAAPRRRVFLSGKGNGFMRSRVIGLILALGLLGGGTGALAAAGGGPFAGSSKSKASANSQYCPPTSGQPGKPKKPGPAKCGNAKEKKAKHCKVSKKGKKHGKKQASNSKKRTCVQSKKHKSGKKHKNGRKHKSNKHHGKK